MPQGWKHTRVTPPFKRGVFTDMDNNQPTSVLPVASKLLESEHKLPSPFQCGFRANHSTEFAAVAFPDFVRRGMNQGLLTGAVLLTCVKRLILSTTID